MPKELSEKEILTGLGFPEEEEKGLEIPAELEPYLQKKIEIEKELYRAVPVVEDFGQVLVSSPAPQNPKIVLPVSWQRYLWGFHQPVVESVRWLVEWIKRLIKMRPGRVVFYD